MIIFQELMATWGKDLRSEGDLRRSIPEFLALPATISPQSGLFDLTVHTVSFLGENGFEPSNSVLTPIGSEVPFRFESGAVSLSTSARNPQSLAVKFKWKTEAGAPRRPNRHIVNLEMEQWVQILYNGRTGVSGTLHKEWRYSQRTANIAFTGKADLNVFSKSAPVLRFESMANLR
jgi:hypothetical protein